MLKIRVIPTLLWKNFGLVKGVQFDSWRRVGPVLPAIKVYNQRDVDELILVDILASEDNVDIDIESVQEFSRECFIPLTVGGGIKNLQQVQELLRSGADKVSINTSSFSNINLISSIAKKHGCQSIIASIDVKRTSPRSANWICYSHRGQISTGIDAVEWAKILEDSGAGEILVTSIDKDGTLEGYDFDLIESIATAIKIPIIASGGAGTYDHMIHAVKNCGASAVAAASMFHFTQQTPAEAKEAMRSAGLPVREAYRIPQEKL